MDKKRILIVEDSRSISQVLKKSLENGLGLDVVVVEDFATGAGLMDLEGDSFFLSILDLTLPDAMHGEIVDHARKRSVPAVVFTSTLDNRIRQDILTKNVIDYVVKSGRSTMELIHFVERLWKNSFLKVLVVDDSPSARNYMSSLLRLLFFEVLEASGGEEALEIIEEHEDVLLVVTDYEMPSMDGVELVRRIRKKKSPDDMAVIGVSALKDETMSALFLKSGANDFIKKPFGREEFVCRVTNTVEMVERVREMADLSQLKDRFLGMAVHDMRNPIFGIRSLSSLMLEGLVEPALQGELKDMVGLINRESNQLGDLVNDLLDITVIESGKLELATVKTDPAPLLRERGEMAALAARKKNISIRIEANEGGTATMDRRRMGQVLDNLLSNAVKFSPSGSEVQAVLGYEDQCPVFCIRDQGPGIADEEGDRIFGTFQKLSARPTANESSTGLGLAIVKKIVDAHRGAVWVESSPGCGAAFLRSPAPPFLTRASIPTWHGG